MKNLQKGFIVPLLIAIVALLAIGGGVYFYVQNYKKSQIDPQRNLSEQSEDVATSSDFMKDWKTYTNPKYGFEIKYPDQLKQVGNGVRSDGEFGKYCLDSEKTSVGYCNTVFSARTVTGVEYDMYNKDGIDIFVLDKSKMENVDQKTNSNVKDRGNLRFVIVLSGSNSLQMLDIYNKVVMTFKFTTPASTVSNNIPHIDLVREYDSSETNIIHYNTNRAVTIAGSNLIGCNSPHNCELSVIMDGKPFSILTPSNSTTAQFIPLGFTEGTYDLYVVNNATGQKSNVIKVKTEKALNPETKFSAFPSALVKSGEMISFDYSNTAVTANDYFVVSLSCDSGVSAKTNKIAGELCSTSNKVIGISNFIPIDFTAKDNNKTARVSIDAYYENGQRISETETIEVTINPLEGKKIKISGPISYYGNGRFWGNDPITFAWHSNVEIQPLVYLYNKSGDQIYAKGLPVGAISSAKFGESLPGNKNWATGDYMVIICDESDVNDPKILNNQHCANTDWFSIVATTTPFQP